MHSLGSNAKHEIIVTSSKGDDNPKKFESTPFPDEAELDLKLEASATEGPGIDIEELDDLPSDLWSAAYRDAVINFGKGVNVAILKGENVAELFKQLEKLEKDATQESAFLRGVKYLQSLQVPLERFKLALDLASPLTSMEPTTATVCGVVKGVTAVSHDRLTMIVYSLPSYCLLRSSCIDCNQLFNCRSQLRQANWGNVAAAILHR